MLLPNQFVEVRWNAKNYEHYFNLGYTFTKINDKFLVRAEDLTKGSHAIVKIKCDFCGKIYECFYYNYIKYLKHSKTTACNDCKVLKTKKTLRERYGTAIPCQVEEFNNKLKATCKEKYGSECCLGSKEIKAKAKRTMREKYGVEYPSQNKEILDRIHSTIKDKYGDEVPLRNESLMKKAKETAVKHYGVEHASQCEEVKEKAKQTCILKYGGESSQSSPEVRKKSMQTMKENGNIGTSKPEKEMINYLEKIYGKNNCIPQYPIGKYSLDCLLILGENKIDVEYDGAFWHSLSVEKDLERDKYLKSIGYKVLRFLGDSQSPTVEQIISAVNYLVDNKQDYKKVDIR